MLLTIVVFVLILSVLVLIHEFGHFIVAKKLGIKVEEFGFGFPPKVFGIKRGETVYSINALPIGGFVKLYGEDEAGGGKIRNPKSEIRNQDLSRAFFVRPVWQRLMVVIAGVLMNFLLAVVLISYLFATQGVNVPSKNIRIVDVQKNTPAQAIGLKPNDVVVSVNNKPVDSSSAFISETRENLGKTVSLKIRRDNQVITKTVTPRKDFPEGEGPLGVTISNIEIKKYAWYEAPFFGTMEAFRFSWMIVQGLGAMVSQLIFHGERPTDIAGPIGVAQITGQVVSHGLNFTLWFTALLSLNLAVLNILPIPALDGGRLAFIAVEGVFRRKVHPRYEAIAHAVGLALLLALLAIVTVNDILRIISGGNLFQP